MALINSIMSFYRLQWRALVACGLGDLLNLFHLLIMVSPNVKAMNTKYLETSGLLQEVVDNLF